MLQISSWEIMILTLYTSLINKEKKCIIGKPGCLVYHKNWQGFSSFCQSRTFVHEYLGVVNCARHQQHSVIGNLVQCCMGTIASAVEDIQRSVINLGYNISRIKRALRNHTYRYQSDFWSQRQIAFPWYSYIMLSVAPGRQLIEIAQGLGT